MFARLSILVLLLTANLSSASPSSIGNAYQNMPATRSSSPLKRTTRTAFANNRANSTRVARSLPLLPLLGQILPVTANLKVDICLDLSVKVLGIATVNVFATAALAASITSQGISVDELAVVQASLASELAGVARVSTTSYACEQACTSDVCSSYNFDRVSHTCSLTPQQLTTKSNVLARLIAQLSLLGPSAPRYCQLCRNRCGPANSTPSATSKYYKRQSTAIGHCPTGLDACPISSFNTSPGYECVNTQEELEHCGGCSSTGDGVDCNTISGVESAGCSRGQCMAFACKEGFYLGPDKTCIQHM
ncbi:hypothetical protein MJO29_013529 [Puccinia striiformis f. sp. tritici]|uniref:Apple domain-containing protein n=3 Tax=Puccinia striiformis TaxID=27350 RepID=A0A0L0VXG1_9BASI|nr:hypothetical protein Pst134EA_025773 [Puccinia striiformis f. sp. tritici]KAH9451835.1 hypothetical protein Pst134EA_025773 [Puccinia striiformis f. sp. tritici]KAI7941455.1 hypothetical protein MJO29_013529 [Puccinia striiformis f. sp. tritici]KNF03715.1 hypothetical protein PSTG_03237 [Puccinia striiformis f. sp. tritici PST-78]POW05102.1 hypothetical protein PSHT_10937 [Puccinia striiformis]